MELYQKTIHEVSADLKAKKVSSVELTKAVFSHLEGVEPKVQAFITLTQDVALAQAAEADKRLASGKDVTLLTGVPLGIKDLLCTKGVRTTCGSKMLENFVPPYDAMVVEKLNAEADAKFAEAEKLRADAKAAKAEAKEKAQAEARAKKAAETLAKARRETAAAGITVPGVATPTSPPKK